MSIIDAGAEFFGARSAALGLEDALLEAAGARGMAAALEGGLGAAGLSEGATAPFDFIEETLAGEAAIDGVGPGILDGHGHAGGRMDERHGSRDFVHMLAAGTGGAGEGFLEIGLADAETAHAGCKSIFGGLYCRGLAHRVAWWRLSSRLRPWKLRNTRRESRRR
jgi:hypothetical protein